MYADPIFHPNGDYPEVMKKLVAERSKMEGFRRSRLPEFTKEEVEYIRGTYDFLGLNHYTTVLIKDVPFVPISGKPSVKKDSRIMLFYDPSWPSTTVNWNTVSIKVVPWGFTRALVWMKKRYGNIPIYITENGFPDHGDIDDQDRINYHKVK